MRVAYFTDIKLNSRSAQTVHVDSVCEEMARAGNDVVLYVAKPDYRLLKRSYVVKYIPVMEVGRTFIYQFLLLPVLLFDVLMRRPNVFYIRHGLLLFVPSLIAKIFNIPVVLEVNGLLVKEAKKLDKTTKGKIFLGLHAFEFIESINYKIAKRIVCVTEQIAQNISEHYGLKEGKAVVVRNGVDTEMFKPLDASTLRQTLNFKNDTLYVGYVGSFISWQGLQYVVEAAKLVSKKRSDIHFVLVGEGDERTVLEAYVEAESLSETVHILPAISRDEVPLYINAFDVCLCVPTRFREGNTSPIKGYEYLACGKPTVVSDILGLRDEFGDAVTYVEPESAESLAERIVQLSESRSTLNALHEKAQTFAHSGISWESVTRKLLNLCNQSIQEIS